VIVNLNSSVTGDEPSSTKSLACGGVCTGGGDEEIELEKSNILLIGPTGSGCVDCYVFYNWKWFFFANVIAFCPLYHR
jgi:hypothetical protein